MGQTILSVGEINPDTIPAKMPVVKAGAYFGMSTTTTYRHVGQGTFPVAVQGGGKIPMWVRGADVVAALGLGKSA